MTRGFYSVIQYCPDRSRAEAVNVGLVLLQVDPHEVRVDITTNYKRVRSLFGVEGPTLKSLKLSTHGIKSRLERSFGDLKTMEDLATFAATRANDLRLTEPRLAKLDDVDADFTRLFGELVFRESSGAMAEESPADVLPPALNDVLYRLQRQGVVWKPGIVTVPVYKRRLEIPYAFRNGVINLIKPHVFPNTKRAETQAATLAVSGDFLRKHPVDGEQRRLVIVSTQETAEQAKEVDEHVAPLFNEYGVRLIRPADAEDFSEEVEATAH